MSGSPRPPHLLLLSADTAAELHRRRGELAERLDRNPAPSLAAIARSLRERPHLPHRYAVVASEPARAARHLRHGHPQLACAGQADPHRNVVFLFAGVGDHYPGLGADLARQLPSFDRELRRCLRALGTELDLDLATILHPPGTHRHPADIGALFDDGRQPVARIHRTRVAQPLLFAVQYALAAALQELGVRPSALAGYSIGEYVAATVAGVLDCQDALRLVARRANLVADQPAGGMLAVSCGADALTPYLDQEVFTAALDGPDLTVLAGRASGLDSVAKRLGERGISSRLLPAEHAFHSPLLDPVVAPLRELVAGFALRPPAVPVQSNSTGTWLREEATSPDYWAGHLRNPVRFADNLAEIWRLPDPVLVELGPGQSLVRLALQNPGRPPGPAPLTVPTLPGRLERRPDLVVFLIAIARLWTTGVEVDVDKVVATVGV